MFQVLGHDTACVVAAGGQEALGEADVAAVLGDDHGRVGVGLDLLEREGSLGREHVVLGVEEERRHFDVGDLVVETRVAVVGLDRLVAELLGHEERVKVAYAARLGQRVQIESIVLLEKVLVSFVCVAKCNELSFTLPESSIFCFCCFCIN